MKLRSFDNSFQKEQSVIKCVSYSDLFATINKVKTGKIIARGSGLSYSPLSFTEGVSIDLTKFNRILEFDNQSGVIKCESGVKLEKVLRVSLPSNWTIPVLPGYPTITVAGCVSCNIHGKSQFHSGNFSKIVLALTLYHPNYGEIECSRTKNSDIFNLTIGGMGLTGIILDITLQLQKVKHNGIRIDKKVVVNVYEGIQEIINSKNEYLNIYSWHDFHNKRNFGKGIIFLESYTDFDSSSSKVIDETKTINSDRIGLPINLCNPFTQKIINNLFLIKTLIKTNEKKDLLTSSFPIYGQEIYFRLFGKAGFLESQIIIPFDKIDLVIKKIQNFISSNNTTVSLASLKLFSGEQKFLNFNEEGICLALDTPTNKKGRQFLSFLDKICIEHNLIMNICKDSRLNAKVVKKVYSEFSLFHSELIKYDKNRLFSSIVSERLGL